MLVAYLGQSLLMLFFVDAEVVVVDAAVAVVAVVVAVITVITVVVTVITVVVDFAICDLRCNDRSQSVRCCCR